MPLDTSSSGARSCSGRGDPSSSADLAACLGCSCSAHSAASPGTSDFRLSASHSDLRLSQDKFDGFVPGKKDPPRGPKRKPCYQKFFPRGMFIKLGGGVKLVNRPHTANPHISSFSLGHKLPKTGNHARAKRSFQLKDTIAPHDRGAKDKEQPTGFFMC